MLLQICTTQHISTARGLLQTASVSVSEWVSEWTAANSLSDARKQMHVSTQAASFPACLVMLAKHATAHVCMSCSSVALPASCTVTHLAIWQNMPMHQQRLELDRLDLPGTGGWLMGSQHMGSSFHISPHLRI